MPYLPRSRFPAVRRTFAIVMLAGSILALPLCASAGLILDTEVRVTMEDNIVGLLSGGENATGTVPGYGMNGGAMKQAAGRGMAGGAGSSRAAYTGAGSRSPSDISFSALAELGGFTGADDGLSFFATGMAERIDYQDYSEYDRTDAGASAGVDAYLSTMCSLRMKGFGRVRRYDNDPDRDGTVAGGATILRQRLGRDLRLSQSAEYESSRAAYDGFSYRGPAFRFGADYALSKQMLVAAGYGFQSQQYRDSSATALRTRTASLGTIYDLTRRWSTLLAYDRQVTKAGTSDVITRNNILSLAVRWAY